ncbi:MAG TPA: hypothetical protein DDW86_04425 [Clostridiales bacterium]|jgi:putative aldouronate transport system substrate-binding protein|nr:hypothetical protein [Clostridiales bacterium]
MKKKYRILSLIAVTALLGGCGKGATPSSPPASDQPESTPAESSEVEKELYPAVTDGSVTLEYWMPIAAPALQVIDSYAENTAYKKAEEATGVKIKFTHPAVGKAKEQFNVLMSGGDLPDMIQYASYYNGGVYKGYEDGAYVDLTPYLKECAPDYLALINEDEDIHREIYKDDKVITFNRIDTEIDIPYYRPMVRQDWLREFNMDIPKTLDDYEAYFQAIQEKKPDAAPFFFTIGTGGDRNLWMGMYDMMGDWYVDNGVIKHYYDNENFKAFLTQMHDWYDKGYLTKDFASLKAEEVNTLFDSGKLGCYSQSVDNQYSRAQQLQDFEFTSCPNPRLTEDQQLHNGPSQNRATSGYDTAISSNCKNVEAAVKFLNYGYSEEGMMTYNYGVEGEAWNMVDGEPQYTDLMLDNPDGLTLSQVAYVHRIHFGPKAVIPDTKCLPGVIKDADSLAFRKLWSDDDKVDSIYSMSELQLTPEETKERSEIITEVSSYVSEMMLQFITGAKPLDQYDEYLQGLKDRSFDRAKEITQIAYDRYMKN